MIATLTPTDTDDIGAHQLDFQKLNARALTFLEEILTDLLKLEIKRVGAEIQMLNPLRQDYDYGSFSINVDSGLWADFSDPTPDAKGGDVISLVAYLKQCKQVQAGRLLERFIYGLDASAINPTDPDLDAPQLQSTNRRSDFSITLAPALTRAPAPVFHPESRQTRIPLRATQVSSPASLNEVVPADPVAEGPGITAYRYNDAAGRPVSIVYRRERAGKKDFSMFSLARGDDSKLHWVPKAPPKPRPLFGLEQLARRPESPVVICEGEKAAGAAVTLLPEHVAITTMGGAQSPGSSDFSPLAGRQVLIAPDHDAPGQAYKDKVIELVRQAGGVVLGVLHYPAEHFGAANEGRQAEVQSGYDLADALAGGWTSERFGQILPAITEQAPPAQVAASQHQVAIAVSSGKVSLKRLADAFVAQQFDGNLCHSDGAFRTYRDGYWPRLDVRSDMEKPLVRFLGNDVTPSKVTQIIALLEMQHSDPSWEERQPSGLICVRNGTLDPTTATLMEHSPEHRLPLRLDINWNPDAQCPVWLKTLDEIFAPDADKQEKIALLQESMGYYLIPSTRYHKFVWMTGRGGNGKSLVLRVIETLVGSDYVSHAQIERLQDNRCRAELQGKLLNISSDMTSQATVADGFLKALVSGDKVEAERKYERPFSFKPYVRFIGATNTLPRLLDYSDGFFRRAIILTFNRQFADHEQDPNRFDQIESELPGILAWAVNGLRALTERGHFQVPPSSDAALRAYRTESNPVEQFAQEFLTRTEDSDTFVTASSLYSVYRTWATESGFRGNISIVTFKQRLEALGFAQIRRNHGRYWKAKYTGPSLEIVPPNISLATVDQNPEGDGFPYSV